MTKEEFLALGLQANDVVLVNKEFVGFVRESIWTEGRKRYEGILQTHIVTGGEHIKWTWKEIESIKVIGRVKRDD